MFTGLYVTLATLATLLVACNCLIPALIVAVLAVAVIVRFELLGLLKRRPAHRSARRAALVARR